MLTSPEGFDCTKCKENALFLTEISITVISGRNLIRTGGKAQTVSPFVTIESCGVPDDNDQKFKTIEVKDNGLFPVWEGLPTATNKKDFSFHFPSLGSLRFLVQDMDGFGEPKLLCQIHVPVDLLNDGYRALQMRDEHANELEMSTLLIKISKKVTGIQRKDKGTDLAKELKV